MNIPENKEKLVSFRAFALMVGVSEGGVRKWANANAEAKGVVNKDGKRFILPSVASEEWGKPILEPGSAAREIIEKPDGPGQNPAELDKSPISFTDELDTQADDEVFTTGYFDQPEIAAAAEAELSDDDIVYTGDENVLEDTDDISEFKKDIPEGTTKIEAERIYSVLRARKVKRELQKLEGELVDKGLVYKNLFEFAAEIRNKFMNVPDRVVDNMRAAGTRNEAINILTNEIIDVLKSLAGVDQIKLTTE